MSESFSANVSVVAVPNTVSSNLSGDEVILHLESGIYYGLNSVGARIWTLLQQPTTVQVLCDTIQAEYDVEPAQCLQDVQRLLTELDKAQLVEVVHTQATETSLTER